MAYFWAQQPCKNETMHLRMREPCLSGLLSLNQSLLGIVVIAS